MKRSSEEQEAEQKGARSKTTIDPTRRGVCQPRVLRAVSLLTAASSSSILESLLWILSTLPRSVLRLGIVDTMASAMAARSGPGATTLF